MGSTWVYLIRHGEVDGATAGRFFGHHDVALSPTGLAQVRALGERLAEEAIEAVYASDLRRARDSAAPLAAARGLTTAQRPALREVYMGAWEGLTLGEIRERDGEAFRRWLADPARVPFPGGEHLEDLRARVMPALLEILAAHAGRRVAVVAHGGVNRVLLGEALGLPLANVLRLAQDYACWNVIEYRDTYPVVHGLNLRVGGIVGAAPVERTVQA